MCTTIQKLSSEKSQLLQRSKERASVCLRNREYDRAVAHMLIIFKLQPDNKIDMKGSFLFALGKYKKQLEEQEKWDNIFDCYNHALEIFPECEYIHHDLGSYLFKLGHVDEAVTYFRKCLTLNPDFEPARISLENIHNSVIERWHFIMLNDKRRNTSFQQAICHAIQEGCNNILDIGTGTGILRCSCPHLSALRWYVVDCSRSPSVWLQSIMCHLRAERWGQFHSEMLPHMIAAREGAINIFACEKSKVMYQLAQDILKSNGMNSKITLLHKESTNIQIPRDIPNRVSLVVTEIFDAGLLGENVLSTLHHAWKHLLLPPDLPSPTNSICTLNHQKSATNKTNASCSMVTKQANLQQCSEGGRDVFGNASSSKLEETSEVKSQGNCGACTKQSRGSVVSVTKEVGRVIPNAARMWICLIECHWIRQSSRMHLNKLDPVNFKNIVISCEDNPNEPYTTESLASVPEGYMLLTDPSLLLEVNFNNPNEIEELVVGKLLSSNFECKRDGSLDAIAVWFDLFVDKYTILSTNPGTGCCWEQAIFPVGPHHLHGKVQPLISGTKVTVHLVCENYLKLKHIELTSDCNKDAWMEGEYIFLDCRTIQKINDDVMNSALRSCIRKVCSEMPSSKVIDMTQFAWTALFACKLGAAKVAVAQPLLWDVVSQMHVLNCRKKDCISPTSVEQLSEDAEQCWDVLIADPIEPTGLIRNQVLEDIALLKASCLKQTSVILPGKLRAYVMLVQSPSLLLQSKVIDDSYTLNFKIAEYVNVFQARVHQDIQLSTLPHEKLSHPMLLWEIDFNEPLPQDELPPYLDFKSIVETTVVKTGDISALVFWFELDYGNGNIVSTANPACSWRQAAVVLSNSVHVCSGEKLTLMCTCKKSVVDIHIQTISSWVE